jgi:hypothetical protein
MSIPCLVRWDFGEAEPSSPQFGLVASPNDREDRFVDATVSRNGAALVPPWRAARIVSRHFPAAMRPSTYRGPSTATQWPRVHLLGDALGAGKQPPMPCRFRDRL